MASSEDKRRLIDEALKRGVHITSKQLDRWRADRLLPTPQAVGRGRGQGVLRESSPRTVEQLVELAHILASDRSLDRAAFRLWIGGYEVPLPRVRKALSKLIPNKSNRSDYATISNLLPDFQETLIRHASAPQRVRKLAAAGRTNSLLDAMARAATGETIDRALAEDAAAQFEAVADLQHVKNKAPPGSQSWLQSSTTEGVVEALDLARGWPADWESVTDAQLTQGRNDQRNLEKLVAFADLAQKFYGEGAFGFSMLTKSLFGHRPEQNAVLLFADVILLRIKKPELSEQLETMAKTVDAAIDSSMLSLNPQAETPSAK